MLPIMGGTLSFAAPRPAALAGDAVDQVMRGQTPPGAEGKALRQGLIRMARLSGSSEEAAAALKELLPEMPQGSEFAPALNRYLERLEVCQGDLASGRLAFEHYEKEPAMAGHFRALAEVTPGMVGQTLAHSEYLRTHSQPGRERERMVRQWVDTLREHGFTTPEEVAAHLAAPPPAPEPEPAPEPTPAPAPEPAPVEPPSPRELAARLLAGQPVDGLTDKKLGSSLDSMSNYLGSLEQAEQELKTLLPTLAARPDAPGRLKQYLHLLELSEQAEPAREGFLYVDGKGASHLKALELMLGENRPLEDFKWLDSQLAPTADREQATRRYLSFVQHTDDRATYERNLALPPEASVKLERLLEVGMGVDEALTDLEHLSQNGFKSDDFAMLRSLRERTPTGAETLKVLDFLRGAPSPEARTDRQRTYLKLVEVGDNPDQALKDLEWLATDRPAGGLEQAAETYLELLGRVDRDHHDELRDCYQKLHENAPPAQSPGGWFRKPVTYEGAFGTLLEFDPDPEQALTDLRLLQKHSAHNLRGGLSDLKDLFKMANARDSEAVRQAYELLQKPPRFLDHDRLKKLVIQLSRETDDLGLGTRMAALLAQSRTEGEFRSRRSVFSEYLELGNSIAQTVGLLETAERCLPPTDDLLKIHPVLLEHNKNRPPELVSTALEQAAGALARGKVEGQSSSGLFRAYLNLLCRAEQNEQAEELGQVLKTQGESAYSMTRMLEPMLDGCDSVGRAVQEYAFVRDQRTEHWPDCPAELEDLTRTHAGTLLVFKQTGRHNPYEAARSLLLWSFEHRNIGPVELITEVGRRLVMGAEVEKAKAEALEHFENGGRIKDKEDHLVIGGVRIGKKEGQA